MPIIVQDGKYIGICFGNRVDTDECGKCAGDICGGCIYYVARSPGTPRPHTTPQDTLPPRVITAVSGDSSLPRSKSHCRLPACQR